MKSLNKVLTLSFLITGNVFAVQHFTCFPPDIYSNDRTIISLKNGTEGTLFLTSGLDDYGNQNNSGVLLMSKKEDKAEVQVWVASNNKSTFTVQIPKKSIGVSADGIKVKLNLKSNQNNVDQELDCYTRMY
ncbi:MAG: hypothetical protein ACOYL6_09730 [Bacteriovoracaceae bacterium]